MEALRLIAETTNHQVTIDLPPGMDAKLVEIIVLPADNELPPAPTGERRKASQLLRGTVVLQDDLIAPPGPAGVSALRHRPQFPQLRPRRQPRAIALDPDFCGRPGALKRKICLSLSDSGFWSRSCGDAANRDERDPEFRTKGV